MSNHQKVYAANFGAVKAHKQSNGKREIGMKNWFRRKLLNFINNDGPISTVAIIASDSGDTFMGDFDGWQFRMHRATGGTILEAWRHPKQNYKSNSINNNSGYERELFLITQAEDFNVELPQILTQLALRQ
jgi:hypothetical protein